ncbi:RNA polymerase sigma-70 factor [Chitinophaga oryziterrae]|uniref:RNA polymerase sigma-70 factor n=1 Tax=Chitinophaga oryziterrae TaxID=1031224 RepID=A0A6N8JF90_9BACT|nr:RNA polymerase sigma-70 factor [Chitinophaga oryziterrae]MVT42989.1 RNA polymerase sigma-70 factor [Chitinophaga oryziterrae]
MYDNAISEKELLIKVAAGDEQAYRHLFHLHWDNIYNVALALTKSVELAEDMVQDIFLKIWQKRAQFVGIERFEDYLFIMARNHIYTELKKRSREDTFRDQIKDYFETSEHNADISLLTKETQEMINQAIGQLTTQQQLVYRLSRDQGLSHEEIAEKLNISRNTVRNHIVQSLKIIRTYLQHKTNGWLLVLCLLKIFFRQP